MTQRHIVTGKHLLKLLANTTCDSLPHGVTDDDLLTGNCMVDGRLIDTDAEYMIWNHARDTDHLPNTIDIDWTVTPCENE